MPRTLPRLRLLPVHSAMLTSSGRRDGLGHSSADGSSDSTQQLHSSTRHYAASRRALFATLPVSFNSAAHHVYLTVGAAMLALTPFSCLLLLPAGIIVIQAPSEQHEHSRDVVPATVRCICRAWLETAAIVCDEALLISFASVLIVSCRPKTTDAAAVAAVNLSDAAPKGKGGKKRVH